MSVEVLAVARVRGKRRGGRLRHLPGGWSESTLPVNVVLVDHPDGLCLFDAGPGERAMTPGGLPWHPWLRLSRFEPTPEDEVATALARRGATRADVRWLVLSHLHVDHVGGVAAYANAEVVVSRGEWERAQGLRGRLRGFVPSLWPSGRAPCIVEPAAPGLGPFPAAYDLAGDRTLVVVPTPGHTPGHVSLLVDLDGAKTLCGGDLASSAEMLGRVAPELAAWCAANGVAYVGAHAEFTVVSAESTR